jgi:hypothetical protein
VRTGAKKKEAEPNLPALIDRARKNLAGAANSAEILETKELAAAAYDLAKRKSRLLKAKGAHDDLITRSHQMQADAIEIEFEAGARLAAEHEAAQERGEVAKRTDGTAIRDHISGENKVATIADLGLDPNVLHQGRQVIEAEKVMVARCDEPTKAKLRKEILDLSLRALKSGGKRGKKNPIYEPPTAEREAWNAVVWACDFPAACEGKTPAFVLSGAIRDGLGTYERSIEEIQRFRDFLTAILKETKK